MKFLRPLLIVSATCWQAATAVADGPLPKGSAKETITVAGKPLEIFTYKPESFDPKTGSLLMVFHGVLRNADEYRDFAKPLGDRLGAIVISPKFPSDRFPSSAYQSGNLMKDGRVLPKDDWTWSLIPKLAAELRKREGRANMPYDLIGHSGGGQFLIRMAAFLKTDARRIVPSNPGTLIFPTRDAPYPYGFGKLPDELSKDDVLKAYLAQPVTLLLGTGDIIQDEYFPKSADAMKQGDSRLQRGRNALLAAEALAKAKGWPFSWKKVEIEGVGHEAAKMFDHPLAKVAVTGK